MNEKIVTLSSVSNQANHANIVDTLSRALDDVISGKREANKCLVLFLTDSGDEQYSIGFSQNVGSMSECVALLEILKQDIIARQMNLSYSLKGK